MKCKPSIDSSVPSTIPSGRLSVWLLHLGEPTPLDEGTRPYRYGQLAEELVKRGHTVVRWAPRFDHFTKTMRSSRSSERCTVVSGYEVELIDAGGYASNVSLARIIFHVRAAIGFLELTRFRPRPDIIVCATPAPELCAAAAWFARRTGVPFIVDVRDLWPDALMRHFKGWRRIGAKPARVFWKWANRFALRRASTIVGVSRAYVDWGLALAGRDGTVRDAEFFIGAPHALAHCNESVNARMRVRRLSCAFFGSLSGHFDFDQVFRAAHDLPDVVFHICGDGPQRERVDHFAASHENVHVWGWVPPERLGAIAAECDIGIAPYAAGARMSSTNKVAEYVALGLPVASSLSGESMNLVVQGGAGWKYDPCEEDGLLRLLGAIRDGSISANVARGNCALVFGANFDGEQIAKGFADVVEDVALDALDVSRA